MAHGTVSLFSLAGQQGWCRLRAGAAENEYECPWLYAYATTIAETTLLPAAMFASDPGRFLSIPRRMGIAGSSGELVCPPAQPVFPDSFAEEQRSVSMPISRL